MIVGFPGETEEDFIELYEFVNRAKFEKLGAFKYSKEDGTPASRIKEQIHPKTKQARYNKLMELENKIATIKLEEKIGNIYEALIEGKTEDGEYYIGRSYMDIPDEDGVIFVKSKENIEIGNWINCRITDVAQYDLIGEKIN